MKKNAIKLMIYSLILSILIPLTGIDQNKVFAQAKLDINAKAAILVDAKTGQILYSQNIDQALPPASMTKMMTEYLILDAIHSGKISYDDVVTASNYTYWMGEHGGSRVFLGLGEKHTVKELMKAMAIYSANDATVNLAEYVGGSEANFVDMMNKKAKEFDMTQTHFLTSTGFPADELGKYTPNGPGDHVMSARDTATLAWHLINDYPEILNFTSTPYLDFKETFKNRPNWNWMLPGLVKDLEYPGVDGLKTGFTEESGYNFTGTAKRNNVRLISVVFGTSSKEERFLETKKLFDYGFVNFNYLTILKAKDEIPNYQTVPVEKGVQTEVPVMTSKDLVVIAKKEEQNLYEPKIILKDNITAPIKKGEILGEVTYEYKGEANYSYLNNSIQSKNKVDLVAKDKVDKGSFFRLFFRKIINFFKSLYHSIIG